MGCKCRKLKYTVYNKSPISQCHFFSRLKRSTTQKRNTNNPSRLRPQQPHEASFMYDPDPVPSERCGDIKKVKKHCWDSKQLIIYLSHCSLRQPCGSVSYAPQSCFFLSFAYVLKCFLTFPFIAPRRGRADLEPTFFTDER